MSRFNTYNQECWLIDFEGLDFLESVKLVNYIRKQSAKGTAVKTVDSKAEFESDEYLQPTLEDDALLFSLDEVMDSADDSVEPESLANDAQELQQRISDLEAQFANYRSEVAKTLDERWGVSQEGPSADGDWNARSSADQLSLQKYDQGYFETYSYNGMLMTANQDQSCHVC